VPKAQLYHSNRKQGFTFELEEGRVVIEGFVNEINKVIILFYLFRVGRDFGATKMFNCQNRQMA
jgi:hypothetical protein